VLLIRVYQTEVLTFPLIEDEEIIKKILKYFGLWAINPPEVWRVKEGSLSRANAPPKYELSIDYSHRVAAPMASGS
jgi:hypothetical protein